MLGLLKRQTVPINVVELSASHLQECAEIHAGSFSPAWSDGALQDVLSGKGMAGFAAVKDLKGGGQKVEGFVIYRIAAVECEIITITTSIKSRRNGIAQLLMDTLIRHCLTERREEIFLEVDETNKAAVSLYRKCGFASIGKRKAYYGAGGNKDSLLPQDAIIMRLDLNH